MAILTVLRPTQETDYEFIIVNEDQIENRSLDDCYDQYGDPLEDDGQEYEVIIYHDGHNWRSKFVGGDGYPDFERVDSDEAKAILADFNDSSFEEDTPGILKGETDSFTFFKSSWQGSFEIAYGTAN